MGHDPTTHARRARCLAHVGSIFNECCLASLRMFLLLRGAHRTCAAQVFLEGAILGKQSFPLRCV